MSQKQRKLTFVLTLAKPPLFAVETLPENNAKAPEDLNNTYIMAP